MSQVTLKGSVVNTLGDLPKVGESLPDFTLVRSDLTAISLSDFKGKPLILNIFPSIDTGVCAATAREFNQRVSAKRDITVLCVSMDLPFAHGRFCQTEGLDQIITASDFRHQTFGEAYGIRMIDGPLQGLFARGVVASDADHRVTHCQLVSEITQEPDYSAVLPEA